MRKSKLKVLIQKEGTKVRFRGSSGGLSGTAVKNCSGGFRVFICFSTETMSVATRLIRCRRLLMIQTLADLRQNHKPSTSFYCLSRLCFWTMEGLIQRSGTFSQERKDEGLDVIAAEGLDTVENMANDLNEVDRATSDLKNTNVRIKDTVTKLRSSCNFCILIILLYIILGIAAYKKH
ncbi:hypothetical protein RHGRI_024051 [Rhododendron griersonianum]|uniref:t-SNARE coiled-coil homology domain-containing protein n=1 Tax=Rhododendron griersonianum TaxID=479676 RepID=A0AAV6JAD8_9ERIC|nr:hypothetical protein RHGRI_024051 [Rhododendron griersonianum]